MERAEQAGLAFHRELAENLAGWRGSQPRVAPALALVFLLHPESVIAPDPSGRADVEGWLQILWSRVGQCSGADRAGTAAAVYGSLDTVVSLVEQRRVWRQEVEVRRAEQAALSENAMREKKVTTGLVLLPLLAVPSCALGGGLTATDFAGAGVFLLSLAVLAFTAFMILAILRMAGDSRARMADQARLNQMPSVLHRTVQGLQMMDRDVARARQLCSQPPRQHY